MKNLKYIIALFTLIGFTSCSNDNETYATNGERIFRAGINIHGAVLQDISQSEIKKVHKCANCHGDKGKGKFRGGGDKQTGSITYYDLTNTSIYTLVYNDDLIKRFIDSETKSDGTHANTGVVYIMKETDKIHLINFLKTL